MTPSAANIGVFALAGLTAIGPLPIAPRAMAQSCAAPATEAEAATCRALALQSRLDELVKSETPDKRLMRSAVPAPQPYVLQYSETDFTMGTSLETLGGFADFDAARRLEEARARLGPAVAMPKPPPRSPSGFDAWTSLRVVEAPMTHPGMPLGANLGSTQAVHGKVGADYLLDRNAVVGLAAGLDQHEAAFHGSSTPDGRLTAYFALKAANTNLDLRAEHIDTSAFAAPGLLTPASQDAVSATLQSTFGFDQIVVAPAVRVAKGVERTPGQDLGVDKTLIEVAPVVSLPMTLEAGRRLEPFVTYRTGIEESSAFGAPAETATTHSAGAGVKLTQKGSSLSATADLDHLGAAPRPELKSRLQLTVPLQ